MSSIVAVWRTFLVSLFASDQTLPHNAIGHVVCKSGWGRLPHQACGPEVWKRIVRKNQMFACCGFKIRFLKKFLDRSVSFSARKLMSMLKPPKNVVWRPKISFFCKDAFKKRYVFLMFSPMSTLRIPNWLFDEISKWFCMVLLGEAEKHVFSIKNFNIWQTIPKILKKDKINENTAFPKVPCGPVEPCGALWNPLWALPISPSLAPRCMQHKAHPCTHACINHTNSE